MHIPLSINLSRLLCIMSVLYHYYNLYAHIPPMPLCNDPSVVKSCLVLLDDRRCIRLLPINRIRVNRHGRKCLKEGIYAHVIVRDR